MVVEFGALAPKKKSTFGEYRRLGARLFLFRFRSDYSNGHCTVEVGNRWGAVEENGPSIPSLSQLRKLEFPSIDLEKSLSQEFSIF